jgi:DOPA 4,5-dioxygenase
MIPSYHAHIYFRTPDEIARAKILREQISAKFLVRLGRWHDAAVGPHTAPMFQVAFLKDVFPVLIPWLMLNRAGLAILLHPNTGRPRDDHEIHPFWFGEILPLKAEILAEISDEALEMEPNTKPV